MSKGNIEDIKEVILEVEGLSFGYESSTLRGELLKEINFSLCKGEVIAIVGKSGAGKSTLLKLLNRLLEYKEGEIKYQGEEIRGLNPLKLRREILYLQQYPWMLEGDVAANLEVSNKGEEVEASLMEWSLLEVGLGGSYLNKDILSLSGGERHRVGLARLLLVKGVKLLLLDEPTGSLDKETIKVLTKSLRRYIEERGGSIIVTTHQIDFAKGLLSRIYKFKDGSLRMA